MSKSTIMAEAVLNRLAILTANRDTEILEASLLKALREELHLPAVLLFKLTESRKPYFVVWQRQKPAENTVDGVPEYLLEVVCGVDYTDQPYIGKNGDDYFTMYPIKGIDEVVGYVVLFMEHELTDMERKIVQGLLVIINNFYSLLMDSQKDKLTGLLNRKTFDESIGKILASVSSKGKAGAGPGRKKPSANEQWANWLAIIDIDYFKKINDEFGHIYGDEVLLMLSQIMKRCFREQDLLFRYGGEEFLVVACIENQATAHAVFDRFRQEVGRFNFPQVGTVTISIGIVQARDQTVATQIVGQADQALYWSKKHGRNCLHFYDDLLSAGLVAAENKGTSADFF